MTPAKAEDGATASLSEKALRLLRAVSTELASLSQDIVRLGEALSGEMLAIRETGRMHDLQSFDLIAQSAQSHAQLLHELINRISEDEQADLPIETLIQIIPFHGVRGRLSAAVTGQAVTESGAADPDDGADWF